MENESFYHRVKRFVFGAPDLFDPKTLPPRLPGRLLFAWVGLGADGITSSCYGPEEAYLALGQHPVLAIFVAVMTVATILIISGATPRSSRRFPSGGGGYIVHRSCWGEGGVVSGSALVIDYILTINHVRGAGADAFFSILPPHLLHFKVWFVTTVILLLI